MAGRIRNLSRAAAIGGAAYRTGRRLYGNRGQHREKVKEGLNKAKQLRENEFVQSLARKSQKSGKAPSHRNVVTSAIAHPIGAGRVLAPTAEKVIGEGSRRLGGKVGKKVQNFVKGIKKDAIVNAAGFAGEKIGGAVGTNVAGPLGGTVGSLVGDYGGANLMRRGLNLGKGIWEGAKQHDDKAPFMQNMKKMVRRGKRVWGVEEGKDARSLENTKDAVGFTVGNLAGALPGSIPSGIPGVNIPKGAVTAMTTTDDISKNLQAVKSGSKTAGQGLKDTGSAVFEKIKKAGNIPKNVWKQIGKGTEREKKFKQRVETLARRGNITQRDIRMILDELNIRNFRERPMKRYNFSESTSCTRRVKKRPKVLNSRAPVYKKKRRVKRRRRN